MNYIQKLKLDTNNNSDIIYRTYKINKNTIYIVYYEPLVSSNKISDFIIRSLTNIKYKKDIFESIKNNIDNFKYKVIFTYDDLVKYLNLGFTIIIVDNKMLCLETKGDLKRSISTPDNEMTLRGPKDAFIEDYQTNMGLIKKRLRTNNLWVKEICKGEHTNTKIGVIYLKDKVNNNNLNNVISKIEGINKDIVSGDDVKKSIEINSKLFPIIRTTERPDIVAKALLSGKIVILVDNSSFLLVLPAKLTDFFKNSEDLYSKIPNKFVTKLLRYVSFVLAISIPGIYIALVSYNLEVIPDDLLISFASQRSNVPFPVFIEAFILMLSFELLRESDLRTPGFTGNSLSIVGALILGDAAVSAGIVSPIMIIVIALTAICSLPFEEYDLSLSLRLYRLIFMLLGSILGLIGIILSFMFVLINILSIKYLENNYLGGL